MCFALQGLEVHFDCVSVLSQCVDAGHEGLAQSWASILSKDLQVGIVGGNEWLTKICRCAWYSDHK